MECSIKVIIEKLYSKLDSKKFRKLSAIILFSNDIVLCIYIYSLVADPFHFNNYLDLASKMIPDGPPLQELDDLVKIKLFAMMKMWTIAMLILYLSLHTFAYIQYFREKKWAKYYAHIVAWGALIGCFYFAYSNFNAEEKEVLMGSIFLYGGMQCLWVLIGWRKFNRPTMVEM